MHKQNGVPGFLQACDTLKRTMKPLFSVLLMLLLILVAILLSPNTQTNSPNKSSLWAYKVSRAGASQFEDLFSISMSQIQLLIFTILTAGEHKQIHLCSKVLNFWTVMNFVGPNSGGVKGECIEKGSGKQILTLKVGRKQREWDNHKKEFNRKL